MGRRGVELGLVHEVVAPAELMQRTMDLARELAEGPQVAMRMLKRSIYNAAELTFARRSTRSRRRRRSAIITPTPRRGMKAFQGKAYCVSTNGLSSED